MSAEKRRFHPGLIQRLADEPYRFEFFQAIRLLLAYYRQQSNEGAQDALGQVIRFRNSISLAFPPSEIESLEFEWDAGDDDAAAYGVLDSESRREPDGAKKSASGRRFDRVSVTPSFIGLTGPSGVLPRHYTQHVAEREIYHRDTATRAFLDIFTSRAVALFYQAWLKYRLHFQYEADREQRFLPMLLSLSGLGLPGTRERLADGGRGVADESLAHYAGALRNRPHSVDWFSRVVADYFRVHCDIEQFVGQWFDLPPEERTALGQANCELGQTTLCGSRVWDRQSKVRLIIGPLRRRQFDDFLPQGAAFRNLCRLFRLMVGTTMDCEVRLVLDKRDIAVASLGMAGGARLGWNAWCKSGALDTDSSDTTYLIKAGDQFD